MKKLIFAAALAVSAAACNTSSESDSVATLEGVETNLETKYNDTVLPSPLLLPVMLKELTEKYVGDSLAPVNAGEIGSNVKKALSLGVLGATLGYTSTYENNQAALDYLSAIARKTAELNISTAVDAKMVERFKNNLNNKDSVNALINESYASIEQVLNEGNRDKELAYIFAGTFIESLNFIINSEKNIEPEKYGLILAQQKQALDKLLQVFPSDAGGEAKQLHSQLTMLSREFEKMKIEYEKEGQKAVKKAEVKEEQKQRIARQAKAMRGFCI